MNLKKEIIQTVEHHQGTEQGLHRAVKDVLNDYRRSKIPKLSYNLKPFYNDVAPNRTALSECISIKGMSERSIYDRLVRYEKNGFNNKREHKGLTKEICRVLKVQRDDVLVPWNG